MCKNYVVYAEKLKNRLTFAAQNKIDVCDSRNSRKAI